jgi:predicted O-methyltransferase YrrM
MIELLGMKAPTELQEIERRSNEAGFTMGSGFRVGALLSALAATKPGGRLLELGTGAGAATAWLLHGMDCHAGLLSIDNDPLVQNIARDALREDSRVEFRICDGSTFLSEEAPQSYDFVFADAWPGKYGQLELALGLVKPGGMWVCDDMLPHANWPDGHQHYVDRLLTELHHQLGWRVVSIEWDTGCIVATRMADFGHSPERCR